MQGDGGVGGLLAVVKDSATYIPAYDANGNIMEYVSADGAIAAHREYDPFGGTIVKIGDTDSLTHWFSTKPWCGVAGLSEYQYREYSPVMGRWLNRDLIEENGGVNLFGFCLNSGIIRVDSCGYASILWGAEEGSRAPRRNGNYVWQITGWQINDMSFLTPQATCDEWDWFCKNCCKKLRDGEAQIQMYVTALRRDRPWFFLLPFWSVEGGRDLRKNTTWYFRGHILRGDQMGNVQAGYGLADVYGVVVGANMCETAEWTFGLGGWLTGDRRRTNGNWYDDAIGSFEMNELGIQALLDDIADTALSDFESYIGRYNLYRCFIDFDSEKW